MNYEGVPTAPNSPEPNSMNTVLEPSLSPDIHEEWSEIDFSSCDESFPEGFESPEAELPPSSSGNASTKSPMSCRRDRVLPNSEESSFEHIVSAGSATNNSGSVSSDASSNLSRPIGLRESLEFVMPILPGRSDTRPLIGKLRIAILNSSELVHELAEGTYRYHVMPCSCSSSATDYSSSTIEGSGAPTNMAESTTHLGNSSRSDFCQSSCNCMCGAPRTYLCSSSATETFNVELVDVRRMPATTPAWLEHNVLFGTPVDAIVVDSELDKDILRTISKLTEVVTSPEGTHATDFTPVWQALLAASQSIRRNRTLLNARWLATHHTPLPNLPWPSLETLRDDPGSRGLESIDGVDPLRLGDWSAVPRLCGALFASGVNSAIEAVDLPGLWDRFVI